MTHSPRPTALAATIAAVVALAVTPCAMAQDESAPEQPTSYTSNEDGSATHSETGIVCPPTVGDLVLMEVLSYDRNDEHLGLSCNYASQVGSSGSFSLFRKDVVELTGPGTDAERWNRGLYSVLANYNGALPTQVDGLDGDDDISLRGALFTANGARGMTLQVGLWRIASEGWEVSAEMAFLPTTGGWTGAGQLRQAVIEAKTALESN